MSEQNISITAIKVVPVEGKLCRSPEGMIVPEEGMIVILNTYWNRRIKDGDVRVADPDHECSKENKPITRRKKDDDS